jgi:hypothetical protein
MARFRVEEIQRRVQASIEHDPAVECAWHGLRREDLDSHLVNPPRSVRFTRDNEIGYLWKWIVYDERPGEPSGGYLVVYDPRTDRYDLATKPNGHKLGCIFNLGCNTLAAAVRGM